MKIPPKELQRFLKGPPAKLRAALVYGPDTGLVQERATTLAAAIVPDLNDPFNVSELTAAQVAEDGARLHDEAAAQSLMGGRRLVRVRQADDSCDRSLGAFLDAPPPGDSFVVLDAGDLSVRSKLRKRVEAAANAAVIPCYVEQGAALESVLEGLFRDRGLAIDRDALAFLAGNVVGDRAAAHNEVEKLTLFAAGQRKLSLADVRAVTSDSSALDLDEVAQAVANRNPAGLDLALQRLFGQGESAIAILRACQRHFLRLHLAAVEVAAGKAPAAAIDALKPPVYFKVKPQMIRQVERWSPQALMAGLEVLVATEAACKRTGVREQTVCADALLRLAAGKAGARAVPLGGAGPPTAP